MRGVWPNLGLGRRGGLSGWGQGTIRTHVDPVKPCLARAFMDEDDLERAGRAGGQRRHVDRPGARAPLGGRVEVDALLGCRVVLGGSGLADDDRARALVPAIGELNSERWRRVRRQQRGLEPGSRRLRLAGQADGGVTRAGGCLNLGVGGIGYSLPTDDPSVVGQLLEATVWSQAGVGLADGRRGDEEKGEDGLPRAGGPWRMAAVAPTVRAGRGLWNVCPERCGARDRWHIPSHSFGVATS